MAHDRDPRSNLRLVAVDGRTLREPLRKPIAHRDAVTTDHRELLLHVRAREELPREVLADRGSMDADLGTHLPMTQSLRVHVLSEPHRLLPLSGLGRVPDKHPLCQHKGASLELGTVDLIGDHIDMIPLPAPVPETAPPHYLKQWRKAIPNLSQRVLAERVSDLSGNEKFDRVRISKMENFKEKLTDKNIHLLAKALNIAPGWLFDHPDDVARDQEILHRLRGRTPDEIEIVVNAIDSIQSLKRS